MRGLCADEAYTHILNGTYSGGQANWLIHHVINDPVVLIKLAAETQDDGVAVRCVQKLNNENLAVRLFCTFLSGRLMGACVPYINDRVNINHCLISCLDNIEKTNLHERIMVKLIAKLDDRTMLNKFKIDTSATILIVRAIEKRLEELPNAIDFIRN